MIIKGLVWLLLILEVLILSINLTRLMNKKTGANQMRVNLITLKTEKKEVSLFLRMELDIKDNGRVI